MTSAHLSQTIVVLGTGTMAVGIAAGFIEAGMPLVVLGRSIEKAEATLADAHKLALSLGAQVPSDASHHAGLIQEWSNWTSVAWLIETVTENFELKRALFQDLDHRVPAHIPIGTNSSGFPISRIADGLKTRSRMFNAHYFMPAHLVPLVEVALGADSDPQLGEAVCALYRRAGKKPVLVRQDIPGLLANRIQHALMREALDLIDRGIASAEDVDTAVRFSFGFRYAAAGPVLQKEISGWDSMARASEEIYPSLSNTHVLARCVADKIAEGKTGMKAGAGFSNWSKEEAIQARRAYDQRLKAAFDVLKLQ
jgi:3-hydroxybutyryl-CoA dehydrogenase